MPWPTDSLLSPDNSPKLSEYLTHTKKHSKQKQNPKLISLQLNQPHFNQSLLQMSFDCFPNPEPHYVKKDHHHRRYWKVCAIDSKNHFKSRILKIFWAITIGIDRVTASGVTLKEIALIWSICYIYILNGIEVAQSCPTLCDPTDCSLPGSSIHGIFQAIVLEWIAISFSNIYIYIHI